MRAGHHRAACFGVCALVALAACAWPFSVDDAFIVARYVTRISAGQGYTFSGAQPSDGVTGPLWLAPGVVAAWCGLSPLAAQKALSLCAAALALLLVCSRVRRAALGSSAVWIAVAVAVSSLPLVVWSVAGLETGAATLALSALALAVTDTPRARPVLAGACLALLCWLRPELLACGLVLVCSLALRGVRTRWAFALAALGAATVLSFRGLLFHHLLPMTASAKPGLLAHGAGYLRDVMLRPRSWLLVSALVLAWHAGGRAARVLIGALVVHAGAVLLVGGDWMPGRRLFAPVVPLLSLALALGLRKLAWTRPRATALALSLLLAVSALELAPELYAVRAAAVTRDAHAPELARAVCAAQGPVAMIDIGIVGMLCPAQTFVDLGGLVTPEVAYARGGHLDKQVDLAWLAAQRPGLVVLHSAAPPRVDEAGNLRWFSGYSVERRASSAAFMRGFAVQRIVAYAPRYFYVLLAPRHGASAREPAP